MREYHSSDDPASSSHAVIKKKKRGSFLSSSPACSCIIALLKLYCFKSAGGKIPMYLSLSSTNKRGKEKTLKAVKLFSIHCYLQTS